MTFFRLLFEVEELDDEKVVCEQIEKVQNFEKLLLLVEVEVDEVDGQMHNAQVEDFEETVEELDEQQTIEVFDPPGNDDREHFDDILDESLFVGNHEIAQNNNDEVEVEFDEIDEIEYIENVRIDIFEHLHDENELKLVSDELCFVCEVEDQLLI